MTSRFGRSVVGAVIGVLPGAVLILLAQFVITGEWQLTIGAPGIVLAVVGALVGAGIGFRRRAGGGASS